MLAERISARMPANVAPTEPAAISARVRAFHDAYLAGAFIAVPGLIAAFFIHDEDAAASMSADAKQPAGHWRSTRWLLFESDRQLLADSFHGIVAQGDS